MTTIHTLEISTSVSQPIQELAGTIASLRSRSCRLCRGTSQPCRSQSRLQASTPEPTSWHYSLASISHAAETGQMHLGFTIVRWSSCTVLRVAVCTAAQRVTGKGSSSPRCSQDPSRGNRLRSVRLHFGRCIEGLSAGKCNSASREVFITQAREIVPKGAIRK